MYIDIDDITLCDQVDQLLAADLLFSLVSSINKTHCHNITEILLKEGLNNLTLPYSGTVVLFTTYNTTTLAVKIWAV